MPNVLSRLIRIRVTATGVEWMMRGTAGTLRRALRAAVEVRPMYSAALERANESDAWGLVGAAREHGYTSELTVAVVS